MIKTAEANKGEDEKRKQLIEARNQADALIHSTEKAVKDYGSKVSAEDKTAIEAAIADLKTALEGEDADDIKTKHQTLMTASMKLGEAMYAAQQEGDDAAGAEHPHDDGVVDAEFEEVDDDHKSA